MYCPNCGKENPSQTKFCRSCGLGLEKTIQSLTEQRGVAEQQRELEKRKRLVERWLTILLSGSGTILVGFILWGIIYKLIIVKGAGLQGLAFLAVILGFVAALILVIYRQTLNETSAKLARQSQLPQTEAAPKSLPETIFRPVGSVTEHTTELLVAEPRRDTKEI